MVFLVRRYTTDLFYGSERLVLAEWVVRHIKHRVKHHYLGVEDVTLQHLQHPGTLLQKTFNEVAFEGHNRVQA